MNSLLSRVTATQIMSDENELRTRCYQTLERSGTLDNVRAQLRATIQQCMDKSLPKSNALLSMPIENVLINEMIAEYLFVNGYHHTLSVFKVESRSNDSLGKPFI